MTLAGSRSEFGRTGWIVATVLAFIVWWPLGLASLGFVLARRFGCVGWNGPGRWHNTEPGEAGHGWQQRGGCGHWGGWQHRRGTARPSGNGAFDEYRAETLRRLEDEQREFVEYLERLRRAKDKAEFDQFMAERRNRPPTPEAPTGAV